MVHFGRCFWRHSQARFLNEISAALHLLHPTHLVYQNDAHNILAVDGLIAEGNYMNQESLIRLTTLFAAKLCA